MKGIRNLYSQIGVEEYYKTYANEYKNPHEDIIKKLLSEINVEGNVLDLCCGTGEVTKYLSNKEIIGVDPYTYEIYIKNTNRYCFNYTFKDILLGKLSKFSFDTIICSFALHLCENSMLNGVLYQLAIIAKKLIIITPNKKPYIDNSYWIQENEIIKERVRLRIYTSKLV